MRVMNGRWFLVQGTTSKRVAMENEIERALKMELEQLKSEVQRLRVQHRSESLTRLVRQLLRIQQLLSEGSADRVQSHLEEHVKVARHVVDYLRDTSCGARLCVCATASVQCYSQDWELL